MSARAIIIDGNWMIYRAYYALYYRNKGLLNVDFDRVIWMIKSSIKDLCQNSDYEYVVVVFDTTRKTFRRESFKEYKANRKKTPDDLIKNFQRIQNEIGLMGLSILNAPKEYEADDAIATLASIFSSHKIFVDIVTSDRDLLQLVDEFSSVLLFSPKIKNFVLHNNDNFLDLNNNLYPWQIPHLKALAGDKSDNFPGAKGIGPKIALSLLQKYQDIFGIYKNVEDIEEKYRSKLLDSKEDILFFFKLASIVKNIDISNDLSVYRKK